MRWVSAELDGGTLLQGRREHGIRRGSEGDQIRYESPWFAAASALQGDRAASNRARRALTCMAAALRRPQRVGALFVVLCRTPPLQVRLSGSLAGQALRALLRSAPTRRPSEQSALPRGVSASAAALGLRSWPASPCAADESAEEPPRPEYRCELMESGSGAVEAVEMVTQSRLRGPLATANVNYCPFVAGKPGDDPPGRARPRGSPACGLGGGDRRDRVSWEWATSNSHEARWALHHHLVSLLIDRGVQYLVSSGEGPFGALGFTTNVQRYQHLVGYELRHVSPARTVRRRERAVRVTRRRLVASLVLAAAIVAAIAPRAVASAPAPPQHPDRGQISSGSEHR